jgi:hypothetical protein
MYRRLLFAYRGAGTRTGGVLVLLSFFASHLIGQGSGRVRLTAVALAGQSGASSSFGSQASAEFLPEEFGAVGDGLHDDSAAFQAAVNAAQKQHSFAVIRLSAGKAYKICHAITIDYRGQGQILRQGISFLGVGSKVFLYGSTGSFFAINVLLDRLPEQDTKVLFDGIWFYTDNVNRPNGIYTNYACFVTIRNCVFYQLWDAVSVEYGYKISVLDCSFHGNHLGVKMFRTRDSTIMACSAFGNEIGYWVEGVNDAGSDGDVSIVNCDIAGGYVLGRIGIYMKRLYTPHLSDVIAETEKENGILMESCQFANLSNIWLGPQGAAGLVVRTVSGGLDSAYWNISNLTTQTETDLGRLLFSTLSNINIVGLGTNPSRTFLRMNDCHYLTVSNMSGREFTARDVLSAVKIENSSSILFQGGLIEGKPMLFAGPCRFCSVNGTVLQDTDLSFPSGPIDPSFRATFLRVVTSQGRADRVVIEKGRIEGN